MRWAIHYVYKKDFKGQNRDQILTSSKLKKEQHIVFVKKVQLPCCSNWNLVENWFNKNYINKQQLIIVKLSDIYV